jgi:DNA-binding CsgD family transcriptional regulator
MPDRIYVTLVARYPRKRVFADRAAGLTAALSARELDVLAQVALGCTNAEAAKRLSLKPETVKSYLRSATAKLAAHTRHEAVAKARRARLLP